MRYLTMARRVQLLAALRRSEAVVRRQFARAFLPRSKLTCGAMRTPQYPEPKFRAF
jgi:hypothetical protein